METSPKTILLVAPYFPPDGGGLERYAFEIAKRLAKGYNWRIVVMVSGKKYGEDTKEESNGLTIYRLGYSLKISNTPLGFLWFGKIRKILKTEKPDIINIHTPVPGIGDITSFLAGSIPTVVTYHTGSMLKSKILPDIAVRLYEYGPMRLLLNQAKHIICSSDFVRFNFLGRYIHKSTTITPAVDVDIFKPDVSKKAKDPTVLFVAGLGHSEQYKGLATLLNAISMVKNDISNIRLIVAGDGDMRSEYESQAEKLGIGSSVDFRGKLSNGKLVAAYQEAHIFVLPTSNDSFPLTILEAMATELPVVSTRIGSIPSIIESGQDGFLINGFTAEAVASDISKIIKDEIVKLNFGLAGRKKVLDKFNWKLRADQYQNVLSSISEFKLRTVRKIAIVTPYFYPKIGGLENYALEMGRALRRDGNDIFVITSNHLNKKWQYEEIEGMKIYRMPRLFKISNTPVNPLWYLWVWRILRLERPDLINAHTPVPFIADVTERVRGNIPLVLNYHNDLVKSNLFADLLCRISYIFMINKTLRDADKIIATSQYYASQSSYLRPLISKIDFVPPGVDINRYKLNLDARYFKERFKDFRTVLFVGQLDKTHRHKGLDDIIKAVAELRSSIKNIKLVVVGKGNNIDSYKKYAASLGIENQVSFEGFVEDDVLPQYYAGADVLVLPSKDKSEGFGMVITEAAACGTPAVASRIGGIPAALIDGETGILVSPNNVLQLSAAMKKILDNGTFAKKLGDNASLRIKKEFALSVVTSKFVDIICKIEKKISILQVVPYYPPHIGGMELRVRDLSTNLVKEKVDVNVITSNIGAQSGYSEQNGVKVNYLPAFNFANTPFTPGLIWYLLTVKKPDVFHIHISQAFFPEIAAIVAKIRGIPYITHIRLLVEASGVFGILLPIYRYFVLKPVLLGSKYVITLTEDDKEIVNNKFKVPLPRIKVIPNATDFGIIDSPRTITKPLNILAVGRISLQKNYSFMLQVMSEFKKIYGPDFKLKIVGTGDGLYNLKNEAEKLNLKNNILFLDEKIGSELEDIYSKSDIFLHTSTKEGFGTVFIEAMTKGLPVVASNIPGSRNVIMNGRNGLLSDFSSEDMAKKLELLCRDQSLYQKISENNISDVKKYNWDNVATDTINTYLHARNF